MLVFVARIKPHETFLFAHSASISLFSFDCFGSPLYDFDHLCIF